MNYRMADQPGCELNRTGRAISRQMAVKERDLETGPASSGETLIRQAR